VATDDSVLKLLPGADRTDPLEALGVSGLEQHGGMIHEEFLPELRGKRGIKVLKQMRDNDPVIGALLFAIEMLIRQVDWSVEPASESPRDVDIAEFVESCLFDMHDTWDDTLSEILSMLWAGFAPIEEVYKRRSGRNIDPALGSKHRDGRIGWKRLALRAQETIERWLFDEHGDVIGLHQQALPDFSILVMRIQRRLLFRPSAHKGNPEGRSILRNAYRPWYMKTKIETIEAIGVDRDLTGLPMALVPPKLLNPNCTDEQRALRREIEQIVTNIRRDEKEGIVFPLAYDEKGNQTYKIELLTTGGQRQFDTDAIINRYDRRIVGTVLADFLMLGQAGQTGSFALAESKTELFAVAIGAFLEAIVEQFNRFAIPRLLELNAFVADETPTLAHGDIESVSIEKLGAYVAQLTNAGIDLTGPATQRHLRQQAGLPDEDPSELPLPPLPGPQPPKPPATTDDLSD